MQQLSEPGAGFIAHFEGVFLYAYPDPGTGGEPWTIGIGATHFDGFGNVRRGDTITLERAVNRFRKTMNTKYGPEVSRAIRVPLAQHEFDMAVSLHMNTGSIRKGSIDNKLNRGDVDAALATWARYKHANGRVMAGLVRRRKAEIRVFRTGDYPDNKIMIKTDRNATPRYVKPEQLPWGAPEPTVSLDFPPIEPPPLPEKRKDGNFLIDFATAIWRQFNADQSCTTR